uniref:KIB1-4 beta-propeller domain-containing protein n=1 Tax=Oryza punctata TaxID=4537 RepID=A0A0E0KJT3_ORYPU
MAEWSTLPADLINRIASCFLDTGYLDYYMDYRAVCRGWRSATDDPKANGRDPRFRPRHWAMLDEVFQTDARLFVNTATGRFLRKDLPLLGRGRRYRLVASAPGGDLVLAEASPPHAMRVLNPFTGSVTRFAAALPSEDGVDAHVIGACPTLVLLADSSAMVYFADPDSEAFSVFEESYACNLIRLAVIGGRYAAAGEQGGSVASILLPEAIKTSLSHAVQMTDTCRSNPAFRCFVVESAGEVLLILKLHTKILQIYKMNTQGEGESLEEVKRLAGGRAIFVGVDRCLSINADKFDSIDGNRIYYQECDDGDTSAYIYMYDLESEETAKIGGAINSLNPVFLSFGDTPPFSPIQLFCSYAQQARRFRLAWEKKLQRLPDRLPADLMASISDYLMTDFEDEFND